ncbi:inorganic diphosphatase [Candidatus Purcelliella pentastirinorum]|uniref:Inorganic pyrophosphatase n=1 Tax=Candidatus Purcelliella pentastirinorum TaxID=472834 RepID=A0A346DZR8_9ENTR|nr:inorganic diphosphatase [Candidatus Purcelliella pentastirinorum]AXN02223.1 Inorganic pyrophosphatase [Candidatus Purcelliella pentastirinorum]WDI78778.1 inorganic diphosphatase [Candidatus Purcelliella pentastirinorum]WDR79912.1 inorganic diphosphatase [Candidatus Purcelliella pentastirinorum]
MNFNKKKNNNKKTNKINVVIEISANSNPIKYEMNKKNKTLYVDRIIYTPMFYPCNYGYIKNTLSLDGDPIDAMVITQYSLIPGCIINIRPIGLLKMEDESGKDFKIISVPTNKITNEYNNIKDINDLSNFKKNQIKYFFQHYKDLEKNKWVKIIGWMDVKYAQEEIIKAYTRYKK